MGERAINKQQLTRLQENLKIAIAFIDKNIPAERQGYGLQRARDAALLNAFAGNNASWQTGALLWCMDFIMKNYHGNCAEIVDGLELLVELDFMERETLPNDDLQSRRIRRAFETMDRNVYYQRRFERQLFELVQGYEGVRAPRVVRLLREMADALFERNREQCEREAGEDGS